ncbi:stalk domain-containing protein [Paenibacillus tengchongensis]|uniref:stalk domain-containing protein n=1 Tax=Paenibacillus tengchongensis TaxID=2608684 RepID=UPI00165215B6|nr:stalk domain-containing protein [Paenibacillus tengchongensis]
MNTKMWVTGTLLSLGVLSGVLPANAGMISAAGTAAETGTVAAIGGTAAAGTDSASSEASAPTPAAAAAQAVKTSSASSITAFGAGWLLKNDGSFWIWDYNQSVPTQVPALTGAVASYPGGFAVMNDGSIKHWYNDYYTPAITVEPVSGISSIADVQIWNNTVVADTEGAVHVMVRTDDPYISAIPPEDEVVFVPLEGIDHVTDIGRFSEIRSDMIDTRNTFLKDDGTVWVDDGKLKTIAPIVNLQNIVQVAENYALDKDGAVWTWPDSYAYDLPAGGTIATKFSALPSIRSIKHNKNSTLAIDSQSQLWFWGGTVTGYSDGWVYENHPDPVLIKSLENVKDAFVVEHSLIVWTKDNKVYETTIARDSMPSNPEFTLLAADVTAILPDVRHMIMQKGDGSLWGWGVNKNAELGYGDYEFMHATPVPVQKPIAVSLNGENVPLTSGVITRGGQNFVPLRSFFDKLGAEIGFDGTTKLATVKRTDTSLPALSISVNAKTGETRLNGQAVKLENTPFTVNGVLYLPLRFISEKLGATVQWLPQEERIAVTMK